MGQKFIQLSFSSKVKKVHTFKLSDIFLSDLKEHRCTSSMRFISILQYFSFLRFWNNLLRTLFLNGRTDVNMSVLHMNTHTDATNVL